MRGKRGLSQAELAEVLDVSRQTVNAIEAGRHAPSLQLAMRISRFFGVPIEAIFFDDEPH